MKKILPLTLEELHKLTLEQFALAILKCLKFAPSFSATETYTIETFQSQVRFVYELEEMTKNGDNSTSKFVAEAWQWLTVYFLLTRRKKGAGNIEYYSISDRGKEFIRKSLVDKSKAIKWVYSESKGGIDI